MRREFEMSAEQHERLLEASQSVPYLVIGDVLPSSPSENATREWKALGREMGFDPMTVMPVLGKGSEFFSAEVVEDGFDLTVELVCGCTFRLREVEDVPAPKLHDWYSCSKHSTEGARDMQVVRVTWDSGREIRYEDAEEFYAEFVRITGKRGTVLVFPSDDEEKDLALAESIAGVIDDS